MTTTVATRPANIWTMAVAYTRLEVIEDLSYPLSIVFQQVTSVFPVVLWFFVARLFEQAGRATQVGGDYYTFVVVGLSVSVVLQMALSGFGRRLESAQKQGTLETMLVEPIAWMAVPFAMNVWRVLLGSIDCVLMLTIGLFLGAHYRMAGLLPFAAIAILGILAATGIGTLSASVQVLAKRSQPVVALYGLAASLLGGALFPVETLPTWLRALSYAVPHRYAIGAARAVIMETPPDSAMNFSEAAVALVVFNAVVVTLGFFLFSRSLQYGRRLGLLSGY